MKTKMENKPTHKGYQSAVEFKCDTCGIIAWEKCSHYNKKKRHFCSMKCYSDFRKNQLPKEEQHRYGTGLLSKEEILRRKKARCILNHYLRDKKIKRPCCEICGEKAQAHHEDYNKPIDVKWLCFKHHRQAHGQLITENSDLLKQNT